MIRVALTANQILHYKLHLWAVADVRVIAHIVNMADIEAKERVLPVSCCIYIQVYNSYIEICIWSSGATS